MKIETKSAMGEKLGKILVELAPGHFTEIVEEKKPDPLVNRGDTKNPDFAYLWATCKIREEKENAVISACQKILANKSRYEAISKATGVPWYVVAVIHKMESNCNFATHLHNGDPLTSRTVQVPAGRPKTGNPPFTFEESAIDALGYDGATKIKSWDIVTTLTFLERYNGLGYRNKGIYSPYLWSYTNQYSSGKYVNDGVWDANAVSQQCGAAAILKELGYV